MAWRNLWKHRQSSFLNLVGLSTGLACALLIFLWVNDERSIDKFHNNDEQLFQVMVNDKNSNGTTTMNFTPGPLADALKAEIPEVQFAASAIFPFGSKTSTLSVGDKQIRAAGQYASPDYFNVFSYTLTQGNPNNILEQKDEIVISESLARRLFNTTDNVTGRSIEWMREKPYRITGVFRDVPDNSSVKFDFLLPMEVFIAQNPYIKEWTNFDPNTYVRLKEGADASLVNKKITGFLKRKVENARVELFLTRFSNRYLYGNYENGVQAGGRIEYVKLFTVIALFILLLACINYMNLATAKASHRVKEVGIQKVVGASRALLVAQYIGESILMTLFALGISFALVYLLLPAFNEITGKNLEVQFSWQTIVALLTIVVGTGVVSGSYPALYISRFKPVSIFRGVLKTSSGEIFVRKGLVVFQFVISLVFIISVMVVYRQLSYIQSRNLGFNKENIVSFEIEGTNVDRMIRNRKVIEDAVERLPEVVSVAAMTHGALANDYGTTNNITWQGKHPNEDINFQNIGVDYNTIETLGMQMVEGRSFSREKSSDSAEIIFNEAAIRAMNLKDPVGKKVMMWGDERTIVGVVKDFHLESLHENVKPFAFRLEPVFTNHVIARIKPGQEAAAIQKMEDIYERYNAGNLFNYRFVDEEFQKLYMAETRTGKLSKYFAGLTILISCLGLFGLSAFTAQRRQKEIAVRKVIGASVSNVVMLLTKEFIILIGTSILIAIPIAWWITGVWLNNFAYKAQVPGTLFIVAAVLILFISISTISYQALKAALSNPVKSLRNE